MLFTTSRKPGRKTRAFARDLSQSLPSASYVSRGKSSLPGLIEKAGYEGHNYLLIVLEDHGNPVGLRGIKAGEDWQHAFEVKLKVAKIRQELGKSKFKAKEIRFKAQGKLKQLLTLLGVSSDNEAELSLEAKQGLVRFYLDRKEIGPRFKVEMISFEA